jgi:RND family efflux transporter MFP subunit
MDRADANLLQADAHLKRLNADFQRASTMRSKGVIGQEEYDKVSGDRLEAEAALRVAQANRKTAELNLGWTKVTTRISGRISRRYVDPGNLIKADDTVLTTIVADDTVYAYFDVDERTYLDLVGEKPAAASTARLEELKIPVLMRLANSEEFTHAGYVDFLDNRLNGNTGTIRMRGVFKNPRDTLKSGLFARIRLPIGRPYTALLIPDEALQSDQGRKFVYVVKTITEKKADGTEEKKDIVDYRPVGLGQALQGERNNNSAGISLREIKPAVKDKDGQVVEGLLDGERVIVSGMQRVRPKTQVQVKIQDPPKPPGFPLEKLLTQAEAGRPGAQEPKSPADKQTGSQGN